MNKVVSKKILDPDRKYYSMVYDPDQLQYDKMILLNVIDEITPTDDRNIPVDLVRFDRNKLKRLLLLYFKQLVNDTPFRIKIHNDVVHIDGVPYNIGDQYDLESLVLLYTALYSSKPMTTFITFYMDIVSSDVDYLEIVDISVDELGMIIPRTNNDDYEFKIHLSTNVLLTLFRRCGIITEIKSQCNTYLDDFRYESSLRDTFDKMRSSRIPEYKSTDYVGIELPSKKRKDRDRVLAGKLAWRRHGPTMKKSIQRYHKSYDGRMNHMINGKATKLMNEVSKGNN